MSKRAHLTDIREDEEDQDLKDIIQKYIKKSEELEKQESKVLKQVELVQSAVASLQALNRKISPTTSHSVRINVKEIEEESKKIKEETERIQEEVRQKIEENKKLQDEIDRRKSLDSKKKNELATFLDEGRNREFEEKEIEPRMTKINSFLEDDSDPGIQFFNDKLQKLKKMRKALQNDLELEERKKMNNFESGSFSKNENLQGEAKVDKELIETWKEKLGKK